QQQVHARSQPVPRAEARRGRALGQDLRRWTAGRRLHAGDGAGSRPQRRAAESRSVSREQRRAPRARQRTNRTVGEDGFDELLQGLRGGGKVIRDVVKTTVLAAGLAFAGPAAAQSPNNAGIVVIVTDQAGLVVKD